MVDLSSGQGRNYFITAGVARYVEDYKIARTPAWAERCHLWIDTINTILHIIQQPYIIYDTVIIRIPSYMRWIPTSSRRQHF